jgi:hypothetical protein
MTTLSLAAPNERDADMTGFAVSFPGEFRVVEARSIGGWQGSVEGTTAIWKGSSLGPGLEAAFVVEVEGPTAPGPAALDAEQRYSGGEVVRWGVSLTVTPAAETPSQNLGWALITALVGLAIISVFGVAMMRRARSGPETY